ncbi:hypothetical protein WS105_1096 [Weissella ceti]|uniref:Uncharacterized protein n=1 Tax=Weissella ceti TaxID=759620 RepID=A0A088GL06_9LACO|nr:hypothetical protein WS74_1100 [Weissella ceti]AIM64686.1 hypothetical protein WS105_1096 [Weissella ceti]ELA07343.1 hypothetical protein WCNC_02762 [Weissella ceti NC36]
MIKNLNTDTQIALRDVVPNLITCIPVSIVISFYGAIYLAIVLIGASVLLFIIDLLFLRYTKCGRNRVLKEKRKREEKM